MAINNKLTAYINKAQSSSAQAKAVAILNHAPVANKDEFSVNEGGWFTFNIADLLSNDRDVDNWDLLNLRITSIGSPSNGTLVNLGGGMYMYKTAAGFKGLDSFNYTISDKAGATSTGQVHVNVLNVNDAPVAVADYMRVDEDSILSFDRGVLTVNDRDAELDAITLRDVGNPQHGTLTFDGTMYHYVPNADFYGLDSFTYTIVDSYGNVSTGNVNVEVTPVNDAPIAAADTFTITEDSVLTISRSQLLANDVDADGDVLNLQIVGNPQNGTLTLANGVYTYIPNTHFYGTDSFSYSITDAAGATSTTQVTINITPVDDLPIARPDFMSVAEDDILSFDPRVLTINDYDPDDVIALRGVGSPQHGTLSFDGTMFHYVPDANYNGPDFITYEIDDGKGNVIEGLLTIDVIPMDDLFTSVPADSLQAADSITQPSPNLVTHTFNFDRLFRTDDGILSVEEIYDQLQDSHHTTSIDMINKTISITTDALWSGKELIDLKVTDGDGDIFSVSFKTQPTVHDGMYDYTAVNDTFAIGNDYAGVENLSEYLSPRSVIFSELNLMSNDVAVEGRVFGQVEITSMPTNGTLQIFENAYNYNGWLLDVYVFEFNAGVTENETGITYRAYDNNDWIYSGDRGDSDIGRVVISNVVTGGLPPDVENLSLPAPSLDSLLVNNDLLAA